MAKVTFNESGQMINAETGELISNGINGNYRISSDGSEMKTLDDYGVLEPVPTESEIQDELKKNSSDSDSSFIDLKSSSVSSHIDFGESSFPINRSKYEVTEKSYFMIRFGLIFNDDDGRVIPIKIDRTDDFNQAEPHWVKFRMWTYAEEISWKDNSMEYNARLKSQHINESKLNEMKIKRLLLDWSFAEHDDRLKLLHCDGVLSDESYSIFMGLYPSIASTIVDMMNFVLENNQ